MIPGHKHLVFEEGLQSAWLYETLNPHVDELVVAGITTSRGQKSDKHDAYGLAEKLRVGNLDKQIVCRQIISDRRAFFLRDGFWILPGSPFRPNTSYSFSSSSDA